jgi:hypothetical protein
MAAKRQGSLLNLTTESIKSLGESVTRKRAKYTKNRNKCHHALLLYVFLMIAGSALWLKYALKGDRTGQAMHLPSYLQRFGGKPIVGNFSIDVEFSGCQYLEGGTTPWDSAKACGLKTPSVRVTATIGNVTQPMDGLYLSIRASKDFKTWWQANKVMVPRDNFDMVPELNRPMATRPALTQHSRSTHAAITQHSLSTHSALTQHPLSPKTDPAPLYCGGSCRQSSRPGSTEACPPYILKPRRCHCSPPLATVALPPPLSSLPRSADLRGSSPVWALST